MIVFTNMDLSNYKEAFLSSAREHIKNFNDALENLTQNPSDSELISEIHRSIHSLGSQFFAMNYKETGEYARIIESYFYNIKNGSEFLVEKLPSIKNAVTEIENSLNNIESENKEIPLELKKEELKLSLN